MRQWLAKFIDKVHLIIYCIEDKVRQKYQGDPLTEPCIVNSFSEGSLYVSGSRLSLRLGQGFVSKCAQPILCTN